MYLLVIIKRPHIKKNKENNFHAKHSGDSTFGRKANKQMNNFFSKLQLQCLAKGNDILLICDNVMLSAGETSLSDSNISC